MDTIKIHTGACKMVAHRGVSGLEKENTMAAFVAAGNRSYFGIEPDVHRTGDGQCVVIHDGDTGRVARENLVVAQCGLEQLRGLCLNDIQDGTPRGDLRIPTLEEYARACKRYGKASVLELKDDFTSAQLAEIIGILRAEDQLDAVIFISFLLENLVRLREILPGHAAQYLASRVEEGTISALLRYRLDLDAHYAAVDAALVKRLHEDGLKVNCWTVDSPIEAGNLISMGVDYITSNILEGGGH